ncbi:6-phosphofructo-2-kinase/fructose-2 [Phytophthora nicotianae]|uniref:6-phosphofructo-2-kinase/fructose-2 n=1 Tax=Phytophthora nicotianae TaxID=4792 RepID=A0A0W8DQJ6_PHYNI|nr:6-phosphofructo-2-kinase/fructose-2 [Phytophthora nicotianae]
MKAFSAWRGGDGGAKASNDAVSELQQVILKKDLMILSLQTQLDAYKARYGALPAEDLDKLLQSDAINEPQEKRSRDLSADRKELPPDINSTVSVTDGSDSKPIEDKKQPTPRVVVTSPRFRASSDADEARAKIQSRSSKNVVLDFVEDSPMFRRQLEGFEESITGLRALLKELVAHSKEYAAAGKHFGQEETALADELILRKHARAIFSTSCPELGSLSELFGEMHDTLAQVQSSRVSMLLGVESLLSRSIQQFSEKELLKEAGELRKDVTRLGEEYETLLGKLLSKSRQPGQPANGTGTPTGVGDSIGTLGLGSPALPMGSYNGEFTITGTPPASAASSGSNNNILGSDSGSTNGSDKHQRALERDVVVAHRRFELARFDLVRYMNRIDCMKKFVLVECFNSILYAQLGHFHACHELVKSVEPSLRKRQEMMQVSRKDFEQDELMWASQRELLDKRLSQDVEAIHAGKLFQTTSRGGTGKHPTESSLTLVCDLLLARVRELEGSSLPFCFEVIDANRAKLLLQAASARDMMEWIEASRRSTESALEKQSHRQEVHPEQQSVIDELTEANPCCADCGQEPAEWVSINIGCLLCIECSGIHRSLGVHESKVRSLALDSWDMSLLTLLRDKLGNDTVNVVWEHTIPDGWTKPTPTTSRDEKARFIKAKYHFHGFAEPDPTLSALEDDDSILKQELAKRFIAGASRGDLNELMWCLAHGVDVNVRAGEQNETALHVSAAAGAATCCDYLVVNGASLTLTDKRGRLPYDAAKAGGFEDIKLTLMQKMSLEQYQS